MTTTPILESYAQHLTTVGKSAHTVKAYAHDLGGFAQWFAQTTGETFDPQAIGPRDIAEYRSYLLTVEKSRRPSTVGSWPCSVFINGRKSKGMPPTILLSFSKAYGSSSSRALRPNGWMGANNRRSCAP